MISILFYHFTSIHCSVYHTVQNLFLTEQIKQQNRDQSQQIGCKGQVIICSELRLEIKLRQRQNITTHMPDSIITREASLRHSGSGAVGTALHCMHGLHHRKNNTPVSFPCSCPSTLQASSVQENISDIRNTEEDSIGI